MSVRKRIGHCLLAVMMAFAISACGGGGEEDTTTKNGTGSGGNGGAPPAMAPATPPASTPGAAKSAKRGVAYDLASAADFAALAPGVSWWYNWASQPNAAAPAGVKTAYGMDYIPMLWNDNFDAVAVEAYLRARPGVRYLLVMNEPNLVDQANLSPAAAATAWPRYESIASRTGVKLVGPAITWGTMPGYEDPVAWLDAFYAAYRAANGNRDPQIDYLAFHWYDYGLGRSLTRRPS
ncbi:glycosyl hydrolase [Cupriavidus necator]